VSAFIIDRVYVCARTTYNMVCALSVDFREKVLFRTLLRTSYGCLKTVIIIQKLETRFYRRVTIFIHIEIYIKGGQVKS